MIEGRSSVGRLGLFVHCTNGFGDVGFSGYWTLEMFAVQPVRVYPGVPICQISYHSISGDVTEYQSDKYQHNEDIPGGRYKASPRSRWDTPEFAAVFEEIGLDSFLAVAHLPIWKSNKRSIGTNCC